eukprot:1195508-Prorocentrum_minimum.AAC.9
MQSVHIILDCQLAHHAAAHSGARPCVTQHTHAACVRLVPRENIPTLPASDWSGRPRGGVQDPGGLHRHSTDCAETATIGSRLIGPP